jgi:uncharacterized repeat protein (TIGR03803 family)
MRAHFRTELGPALSLLLLFQPLIAYSQGRSEKLLPMTPKAIRSAAVTGSPQGKKGCIASCASSTQYGGAQSSGVFYTLLSGVETVVHSFGGSNDAEFPNGELAQDSSGNFYGTSPYGGSAGNGTVFKVDSSGNESVIYSFLGPPSDGSSPYGGVTLDGLGNLYGTASTGGNNIPDGGTVFELSPSGGGGWTERILYNFCSQVNCTDGEDPMSGLAIDSNSNLYGTTVVGGTSNLGTVFELSPNGQGGYLETSLYNFVGGSTGSQPFSGVVLDQGNLFGTTDRGGLPHCNFGVGCGLVYKLSPNPPSGWTFSVVHQFAQFDGEGPTGDLIVDSAGNVYGTAKDGGIPGGCYFNTLGITAFGCGTVFEISASGVFSVLYRFAGGTDGASPMAALAIDSSGNLYGTTLQGGGTGCDQENGCGTVFELIPQGGGVWTEYILNRFNGTDGALPASGLKLPR